MVDGNAELVEITRRLFEQRSVTVAHTWVTAENVNGIVAAHGFTGDVDYLGLDLDGMEYWVWLAVQVCDPMLVVAEYNPLFGPNAAVSVAYDALFATRLGMASILAQIRSI